ncbi:polysaccharide deacetylase family protein [Lewinella sp. IMCC34191]|uniref:polysaccharide deacetylase family protein n=1 Tax=Lewinella sp. IMCC34191 TaxID=2259172 RepID=UPI000E270D73|nr:polysaccharide deacetylase family protein [Lewinella sp. IMCC34191]
MIERSWSFLCCFLFGNLLFSQRSVAITIDDVPNTRLFARDGYHSRLLDSLDALAIPVAVFINEGLIYRTDSVTANFGLLRDWAVRDSVTLGNHGFQHARYSATGFDGYVREVRRGEAITRELAAVYGKELRYFRFPYNDLGADSLQHRQIADFLADEGYAIAPFTVESSDWMYDAVYEELLARGEPAAAREIGRAYVEKTLAYFAYFEGLAHKDYGRPIRHIYLCHDNRLNADFLPRIVRELRARNYRCISLPDALADPVYDRSDRYYQKWGVSWVYRWMTDPEARGQRMRGEPSTQDILERYERLAGE